MLSYTRPIVCQQFIRFSPSGWFSNYCFSLQHLLRVVPVIGILNEKKAFKPAPNPDEVEAVFDAPLEMFIKVFLF